MARPYSGTEKQLSRNNIVSSQTRSYLKFWFCASVLTIGAPHVRKCEIQTVDHLFTHASLFHIQRCGFAMVSRDAVVSWFQFVSGW